MKHKLFFTTLFLPKMFS